MPAIDARRKARAPLARRTAGPSLSSIPTLALLAWMAFAAPVAVSAADAPTDLPAETIAAITYDGMPDDRGIESPFAKVLLTASDDPELAAATADFRTRLAAWKPAQDVDPAKRIANLLSLLALADLGRLACESEAPLVVLGQLRESIPEPRLIQLLAACALTPGTMEPLLDIPEFDVREVDRELVRARMAIYARKMLGRVLGKLPK